MCPCKNTSTDGARAGLWTKSLAGCWEQISLPFSLVKSGREHSPVLLQSYHPTQLSLIGSVSVDRRCSCPCQAHCISAFKKIMHFKQLLISLHTANSKGTFLLNTIAASCELTAVSILEREELELN